jgi:hypothetical protein
MKTRLLLTALTLILVLPANAETPIGVDALHEQSSALSEKELAVTGLVDRVSAARGMVVLIDSSEATCTKVCERKSVVVLLPKGVEMPVKGTFLTANGRLVPGTNPPQLNAASVTPAK